MPIGDRFIGADAIRVLKDAFLVQPLVVGNAAAAEALAQAASVHSFKANDEIIRQGGTDRDIYFILVGSVAIERNGRAGPIRNAGQYFGEMALIDSRALRSATVRALEEAAVAKITEPDFSRIAEHHGLLWRNIAIEIADRLRQRLDGVPLKNDRTQVFIGSSVEGLPVAEAIQAGLDYSGAVVRIWTQGVFQGSKATIEALEATVRSSDIAVLVFSPDDQVVYRDATQAVPRDNVVFELGLFMGALGRERTFVVRPRGIDMRIPTDLVGITPLDYPVGNKDELPALLGSVCTALKSSIATLGAK
jgi:predicted nucleotide-binding protein